MAHVKFKAINFDLDTKKMSAFFPSYTKGYKEVKKSFKKYGFKHRQGSGYVSKEKLKTGQVFRIVQQISKENPWLGDCVKKVDVTDVGSQYDLTDFVKQSCSNAQFGKEREVQKDFTSTSQNEDTSKQLHDLIKERTKKIEDVAKNKAINFDLDTKKMSAFFPSYTKGYKEVKKSFKKYGFKHRQGSGYVSKEKLKIGQVLMIVQQISEENPWLGDCINKADVTDIGKHHDLTGIIKTSCSNAQFGNEGKVQKDFISTSQNEGTSKQLHDLIRDLPKSALNKLNTKFTENKKDNGNENH